jgi:uncharacterized SAM-binding protein YcdF (DUF218 family)
MFLISKLVGVLTDPATVVLLLLAAGWLLSLSRRGRRKGLALTGATLAVVVLLAVVPVEQWATAWLENRFPPPAAMPEKVDGIIVLGGAINPLISATRGQVSIGGGATRVTALTALARHYPEARLVYSGGAGDPFIQDLKEADYAEAFYREQGVDTGRIVFERQSRNTRENATLTMEAMRPRPGETWLLVTSAWHMPRAVGCFRAAGWPVVAYPVDYATAGRRDRPWWAELRFNPGKGFSGLAPLIHEAMGLVSYRMMGWTDEIFPKP